MWLEGLLRACWVLVRCLFGWCGRGMRRRAGESVAFGGDRRCRGGCWLGHGGEEAQLLIALAALVGVVEDKEHPGDGSRVIKALGGLADHASLPRWTIIVGPEADAANTDDVLFHWLANSSHDRDRHLSLCGRRVAFDATPKLRGGDEHNGLPVRDWPPIIRMSPEMQRRIVDLPAPDNPVNHTTNP